MDYKAAQSEDYIQANTCNIVDGVDKARTIGEGAVSAAVCMDIAKYMSAVLQHRHHIDKSVPLQEYVDQRKRARIESP